MPSTAALRSHETCGSHGVVTNRSKSSASTSNRRSTATVAVDSASETAAYRFSATIRAASPARKGRMLLKKRPINVAFVVSQRGGRRPGSKRTRQRAARATVDTTSAPVAGTSHQ
jgi:hypothetical protein